MNRTINIGVYRILRKLGINRDEIYYDAQLKNNLFFYEQEWICFMFFIESRFHISLSPIEETQLKNIIDVVAIVHKKLNIDYEKYIY